MSPYSSGVPAILALVATLVASACRRSTGPTDPNRVASASSDASAPTAYYCPMHPDYRSAQPGDCPICNMKLLPLHEGVGDGVAGEVPGRAPALIELDLQKRIGLETSVVEKQPFSRRIRAAARVEVDERRRSAVSLRYGGWIEDLRVRAIGDAVRPGEPLLSIHSPELYAAERSYLDARAALPASDEIVKGARQRLLLWGLTEEQVRALEARGEPEPSTPVLAKVAGVVLRREALPGMRFEAGATLYEIADLSTLWVIAEVFAQELPLVVTGAEASIEFAASPGEPVAGRIESIQPTLDEATRTARVRIELANPDGKHRPGEYATVTLAADLGEQLVVDVDAVIETGTRRIAFVQRGEGRFEPRELRLGPRSDGRAVVLSGLEAGDRVVTSATFLVDSESRLKSALRAHAPAAAGHAGHEGR